MTASKPAWTPGRMYFELSALAEHYVLSHSSSYTAAGAALIDETLALGEPAVMMLAKEQYALMRFLAAHSQWRRALDVGTFTGISALALAEGMGPNGRVVTIDRDPAWRDIARRHWAAAGVDDRIEVYTGEARDTLRALASGERFDVIFLDADKAHVADYFEQSMTLLSPHGLIMVDNTLWHGWVTDEKRADPDTIGMREFNEQIARDERVETVVLPVADGITLVRPRG
jgi:predicted O-methyltransferase YrrM